MNFHKFQNEEVSNPSNSALLGGESALLGGSSHHVRCLGTLRITASQSTLAAVTQSFS